MIRFASTQGNRLFFGFGAVLIAIGFMYSMNHPSKEPRFKFVQESRPDGVKLYWLTADGMRADEGLFNMFKWAQEGKLPNIKKLLERGAHGYSVPYFPSLTSNNIATLHTGATAKTHGIVEGAIRPQGSPLAEPQVNGFSSTAKKVAPSWSILEKAGKNTVVLSVPGSTPPELESGVTIRGRWGNWGFDAPAVTFEPMTNYNMRKNTVEDFYFNMVDKKLTRFVETTTSSSWEHSERTFSPAILTNLEAHGGVIHAAIFDTSDDGQVNYDKALFRANQGETTFSLAAGQWSDWFPVEMNYESNPVLSQARVRVIKIWPDGRFRIRVLYNSLNNYLAQPAQVAEELTASIGPMVDFLDNCLCLGMAPQLIIEPEDKKVALEEARMSWSWHKKAVAYIYDNWRPDVLIQDFYTPNQMLVSRWWLGDVDTNRPGYNAQKAQESWSDLLEMYQGVDAIIGEALERADEKTLVVLSAQHGTAALYRNARLNNLFAKKGWLKYTIDKSNGKTTIDWENSKVVFLKMAHIYIHPDGLGGNYTRAHGPAYEALRQEVLGELAKLRDNGINPVNRVTIWENADKLDLPEDGVGDLIVEAKMGYRFWEEMTEDGQVFTQPLATGYKEGTDPFDPAIQTPFIIAGPGVKSGVKLSRPLRHIDQLPTILKLMNVAIPEYVEGSVVDELMVNPRSLGSTAF